jgi:hypothetical protein
MATQQGALEQIKLNHARIDAALGKIYANFPGNMKAALREVGKIAVAHSVATHEYQNRTGALERSHGFVVAGMGETVAAEYQAPEGEKSFNVRADENEIALFLYAGMFYAVFVELKNGYSVLINTFNMLKRDGVKLLAEGLRKRSQL